MPFRPRIFLGPLAGLALASCTAFFEPEIARLADQPVAGEPRVRGVEAWSFANQSGHLIKTDHFQIYTTIDDPIFLHLLVRVLEAAHDRGTALAGAAAGVGGGAQAGAGGGNRQADKPLDCYIFASRGQWENYTRARAGSNAPIYLQISSGGYCQEGVFAGYDIGRTPTLSVIAHEAWHQYSWFAFKNRLPSWLEEGLATQNEAIQWDAGRPVFRPETNASRLAALHAAMRTGSLWKLPDLLATHAGLVISKPQASIDAYYAQLWSLVLFLQTSPVYGPRLERLLGDAEAGRLVQALQGTGVTQPEIDNFTERWNTIAGPVYARRYLNGDLEALESDYMAWVREFLRSH